jgi:hypothetical protein
MHAFILISLVTNLFVCVALVTGRVLHQQSERAVCLVPIPVPADPRSRCRRRVTAGTGCGSQRNASRHTVR